MKDKSPATRTATDWQSLSVQSRSDAHFHPWLTRSPQPVPLWPYALAFGLAVIAVTVALILAINWE